MQRAISALKKITGPQLAYCVAIVFIDVHGIPLPVIVGAVEWFNCWKPGDQERALTECDRRVADKIMGML